jgi:hypothetical protein
MVGVLLVTEHGFDTRRRRVLKLVEFEEIPREECIGNPPFFCIWMPSTPRDLFYPMAVKGILSLISIVSSFLSVILSTTYIKYTYTKNSQREKTNKRENPVRGLLYMLSRKLLFYGE